MKGVLSFVVCLSLAWAAGETAAPTVPVQMVVSVEARNGKGVPALQREDFIPRQGKNTLAVTDAVPLKGADASLELYLLIDDASSWSLGTEIADLRHFLEALPASTAAGVGYMHNGTVDMAVKLTKDHSLAAKGVRLPTGMGSSPYLSLSELVKRWPASSARREVVMVTSGADPLGEEGLVENPYLDTAIADAQRAGIIVYAIYTPGVGHSGHSYWRMLGGQNYLSELADETGGESYMLGFGTPVSIAPYLTGIAGQLTHQYRVTFLAKAENKPGLRPIKFTTEVPNAEIVAASRVWVPGVSAGQ